MEEKRYSLLQYLNVSQKGIIIVFTITICYSSNQERTQNIDVHNYHRTAVFQLEASYFT